jgi:hypothetical protein
MKYFTSIILILCSTWSYAQYQSRGHIISAGGKTIITGQYKGIVNIGEPVVTSSLSNGNHFAKIGYIYTMPHNDSIIALNLKVYLEGFYDTTTQLMSASLNELGLIPLNEPFSNLGFFLGSNSGISLDTIVYDNVGSHQIVDWILLQLLNENDSIITSQAVLIQRNGLLVNLNGTSPLVIHNINPGHYKIKLKHRNHISIKTEQSVFLGSGLIAIDFTKSIQNLAGGINAQSQIIPTVYAAISADADANDQVSNTDLIHWRLEVGGSGYIQSDFDGDGQSDNSDLNNHLIRNTGKGAQ